VSALPPFFVSFDHGSPKTWGYRWCRTVPRGMILLQLVGDATAAEQSAIHTPLQSGKKPSTNPNLSAERRFWQHGTAELRLSD